MRILHIDCSPRAASHSRKVSAAIIAKLLATNPDARITRRDLGHNPIPHTESDYATSLSAPGTMAEEQFNQAVTLSEQLIQEIEAADVLVIGTPMNNFTVPSVFKSWIDQVVRMGRTIGVSNTGEKVGLLRDRPVYIGIASGGVFTGDGAKQPDFLIPYLTAAFACMGITTLQFLPLQATAFLDKSELATSQDTLLETIDLTHIEANE